MLSQSGPNSQNSVERSFRDLTVKEMNDPELLTSMEMYGLGATLGWSKILENDRILLLSAAGAGKTFECQTKAKQLFAEGKAAFFFTLEGLASSDPENLLERGDLQRLREWLKDGYSTAYFFLDSFDELQLSQGSFRGALRKLGNLIDGQLHRAKIVVTSRPLPVDLDVFRSELPPKEKHLDDEVEIKTDDRFRQLISGELRRENRKKKQTRGSDDDGDPIRIVALTPLSNEQIKQIIELQGTTNSAELLAEIDRKRAWELARRPQELIEICSYWKEHGKLGNRAEQVADDIRSKLRETGTRKSHTKLSDSRALEGAERLALAMILTRKRTIRFSDLSMDEIEQEAALDPSKILSDWNDAERAELLLRPLFGFASYGRVRFHHRSATEFLAARKLHSLVKDGQMPKKALFRIMFGERYGEKLIFPSMRAVATWLALENESVRDEVLAREPEALMDEGDPESFSVATRNTILSAYVERYKSSDWRGVRIPYPQVIRFAAPELSPAVRQLWSQKIESPEVKELLIDMIQTGRMHDCLDLAESVAVDPKAAKNDRVTAIAALAEMSDSGELKELVGSIIDPVQAWPSGVKEGLIEHLFPKHLNVEQFVQLLSQIEVKKHRVGGANWLLPRLVPEMKLPGPQLSELRHALSELIRSGICKSDNWPNYTSKYRQFSSALAALCLREIGQNGNPDFEMIRSAVLAARFKENEYGDEKPIEDMIKWFQNCAEGLRKSIYIAESEFCITHVPAKDVEDFVYNVTYGGIFHSLISADFPWLIELCQDDKLPQMTRDSAFRDARHFIRNEGKLIDDRVKSMQLAVLAKPKWQEILAESLKPPKLDQDWKKQEAKYAKESKARKEKEREAVSTWEEWRKQVLANPEGYFTDTKNERIVWDFYEVLQRDIHQEVKRAHWSRRTIEEFFNPEIGDKVVDAFCTFWRSIEVPLRSERPDDERNIIWSNWLQGLAGVYAEADADHTWASHLSQQDAEYAARYAPLESNGIPPWFGDLITHQSRAVDNTLGKELSAQLKDAVNFNFPGLISDFSQADRRVQSFFASRIWSWLSQTQCDFKDETEKARMYDHLERAIDFRLRHGPDNYDQELTDLSCRHLKAGLNLPFAMLWFTALLRVDPETAVEVLEPGLTTLSEQDRYDFSEQLFAGLGEGRNARFAPDLSEPRFTPEILLRFVRLAYAEIKIGADTDRIDQGAYSPTLRDDAQRGRGAVLSAILARQGSDAWNIKRKMRADPLFDHFKDRLDQLARETAATEAEGPSLLDADVSTIEKYGEAPEADRDGMFRLMMDRISDLQHDLETHEFSEKPILAGISQESAMQVYLSKRLQERANGAYKIDREAMVINAKETDIRLLSIRSDQQAVIEIKLANNGYSLTDLYNALEKQLVGQYMRHDNCRAGCLLITMAKKRTWKHPNDRHTLSFSEVIEMLNERAIKIVADMNHLICLEVTGIDLSGDE